MQSLPAHAGCLSRVKRRVSCTVLREEGCRKAALLLDLTGAAGSCGRAGVEPLRSSRPPVPPAPVLGGGDAHGRGGAHVTGLGLEIRNAGQETWMVLAPFCDTAVGRQPRPASC